MVAPFRTPLLIGYNTILVHWEMELTDQVLPANWRDRRVIVQPHLGFAYFDLPEAPFGTWRQTQQDDCFAVLHALDIPMISYIMPSSA